MPLPETKAEIKEETLLFKQSHSLPFVIMRQATRSYACYHTHSHDEFSFGVIDSGVADYRNMRHKNVIGAGTTVTINPGDAHSCNPDNDDWSYRMLFVDTNWIAQLQQEILKTHGYDYLAFSRRYQSDNASYIEFSLLFNTLLTEQNPLRSESLLIEYLAPRFSPLVEIKAMTKPGDLYRVQQVKELIMDQLDTNLSLDQFAACSGLSRYHFIRCFKQVYGQSPHAFQLDQRITKAKRLLATGNSIIDTASSLGFADQSHFHRNFKKRLALTPKQYQSIFT